MMKAALFLLLLIVITTTSRVPCFQRKPREFRQAHSVIDGSEWIVRGGPWYLGCSERRESHVRDAEVTGGQTGDNAARYGIIDGNGTHC